MHWNGQQKLLGGGGSLNRFYVEKTLALGSAMVKKHTRYSVRVKHSPVHQNSKHINQDPTTLN